jgi:sigma-B regulation protein RsbU (phosphoserine phosphatase)
LAKSYRLLKLAKQKIENYSKALDAEMEKGKKIQRDFLPDQIPRIQGWEIAVYFKPARQVSGDFYDVFLLPGNLIGLVIADVCDKGVGSALFMALFRSLIRVFSGQISLQGVSVSSTCESGSDSFCDHHHLALRAVSLTNDYIAMVHGEEGMFATLFFGVVDPQSGKMGYVNGGHEPVMVVNPGGVKDILKATGPAVGMMPESNYGAKLVQIEPGDTLIGYTDGVTEALSPNREFYTKKRFISVLENPAPTASKLIEQIKTDLFNYIDEAPQSDDITMFAVHRKY